jgi:DNA-binding transcriptional LysR family regulator
MEMHQIRYFLAVARTLNFTRAAEECHVAQPSLTRAIKLLEAELGGELFRRERNLSHLTELGVRMQPLIKQCYESALSAKSLATSIKSGGVAPMKLGLSRSFLIEPLIPLLGELLRAFKGIEFNFQRGTASELAEALKKGDIELALAGPLGQTWERLESWPLFTTGFDLIVHDSNPLAGRNSLSMGNLKGEKLLSRSYCEILEPTQDLLRDHGIVSNINHRIASDNDLVALLQTNVGVAIVPERFPAEPPLKHVRVDGLDLKCAISVYGVNGRQRSAVSGTLLKLLRANDWSQFEKRAA